ncbi:type III PLP-dependent enzyme [Microbacterium ulmi]|uniref:type III PLP-dependent enzyme n=1 Tax=Microbacterium ulmi TaxID=179095 RepID=UPI0031334073|nr:ornithine decarboxylase [Microbacterium ulmi]
MISATRRGLRAIRSLRERRRTELCALLATDSAQAALALHGTPLLLLDPERVRAQYRRLSAALPSVRFHYAVTALPHSAVVDVLAEEGCGFDVASGDELALVRRHGVAAGRLIHTHPVRKPAEIADALAAGVRTFVVDSETELEKFRDAAPDVRVLVRLSFRSPQGGSDASAKFGVGPFAAGRLVARARELGVRVAGFSFHTGRLDDPERLADAVADALTLMRHLEDELGIRFEILDIGGGFPVAYDTDVCSIEEFGAVIEPLLAPHARRLRIIAEPGRILAAEAMALVTSVVGIAERADGRWYHLDDGVHGAYSSVTADDVRPLVYALRELGQTAADSESRRWATLAGPTCDSADVVAREVLLPELAVGDLLASPAMGAYTIAAGSSFNGRAVTPVAVVVQGPSTGPVATRERMPEAVAVA